MLLKNGQRVKGSDLETLKVRAVFKLSDKYSYYNPKAQKLKRANSVTIPTYCHIFNKDTNETEEWRWAETETPITDGKGGTTMKYSPPKITFKDGVKLVKATEPDLYEYLLKCPENTANGGTKFTLDDAGKISTKKVQDEVKVFEAKSIIYGDKALKIEALRKILISTGEGGVEELQNDQVREKLSAMAQKDPVKFISICRGKDLDFKVLIYEAMKMKKIHFEESTNTFNWGERSGASKGKKIVTVPKGKDVPEWFIGWLQNDDNTGVLEEMRRNVNETTAKKEAVKA